MSRLTLATLIAVSFAVAIIAPAHAATVANLKVSSSEDASDAALIFPIGTKELYVLLEYSDAANEPIVVVVDGPGVPNLYKSPAQRYTGSGSDTVKLTGGDIYQSLIELVKDHAYEIRTSAQKAQSQSTVQAYLEEAYGHASQSEDVVALLLSLEQADALDAGQIAQMKELSRSAAEIVSLAQEAMALPYDDQSGKKAVAGRMTQPAGTMVDNAESLSSHAATVSAMPFPVTGLDGEGFLVTAEVAGYLSKDTSFNIGDSTGTGTGNAGGATGTVSSSSGAVSGRSATGANTTPDSSGAARGSDAAAGSGSSDFTQRRSATATPRPGVVDEGADEQAAAEMSSQSSDMAVDEGAPAPSASLDDPWAEQPESGGPQATWTPPPMLGSTSSEGDAWSQGDASSQGDGAEQAAAAEPTGGSAGTGPNVFVLAGGALVLAVLALWMRRSM